MNTDGNDRDDPVNSKSQLPDQTTPAAKQMSINIDRPCKTPGMSFPKTFSLLDAQDCAKLVVTAYDQFEQWKEQGFPSPPNFKWTPKGPANLSYSEPLWGDAVVLDRDNWEPFGFVAFRGKVAYVSYRGSLTKADDWERRLCTPGSLQPRRQ